MEKLDKVIAGLEFCGEANKSVDACLAMCPYYGARDGDKVCMDFLMEDALSLLKMQDKALKSMYKRLSVTLIERDTIREKLIQTREEVMDLRKDIEVLTEELTAVREKLSWQEPSRTPNDWGEYPPEFPREGM